MIHIDDTRYKRRQVDTFRNDARRHKRHEVPHEAEEDPTKLAQRVREDEDWLQLWPNNSHWEKTGSKGPGPDENWLQGPPLAWPNFRPEIWPGNLAKFKTGNLARSNHVGQEMIPF